MDHEAQMNLYRHERLRNNQKAYRYLSKLRFNTLDKNAMWGVLGNLSDEIKEDRKRIAEDCEPWFDGSAFK